MTMTINMTMTRTITMTLTHPIPDLYYFKIKHFLTLAMFQKQ